MRELHCGGNCLRAESHSHWRVTFGLFTFLYSCAGGHIWDYFYGEVKKERMRVRDYQENMDVCLKKIGQKATETHKANSPIWVNWKG